MVAGAGDIPDGPRACGVSEELIPVRKYQWEAEEDTGPGAQGAREA